MIPFKDTKLHGNRIKLRWLNENDIEDLFQIFSNKEAMRYWNTPPIKNIQDAESILLMTKADYEERKALRFGIQLKTKAKILGTCSIFNYIHFSRRAEIGYILNRDFWGQGYMNEALTLLINYAFGSLNLNRLEADVDPRNIASTKTLLRLGFLKEGHLRERWIVSGEISDSELYGLLRNDWKAANTEGSKNGL